MRQPRRNFGSRRALALVATLGLACSVQEDPAKTTEATPAMEVEDRFFDSDGVSIHYTEQGSGEPVVLVHGFAMNGRRWHSLGVSAALARAGYCVLTVDCRGHGRSGKPRDPGAYGAEIAEDIVRLLDHLDVDKAHIVGYSMGALVTNKLRDLHPDRVQTAVLGGAGWMRQGAYALADLTGPDIADSLERTGSFEYMLRRFTANRHPPATEEEIRMRNQRMLEGNDVRALAAVLRSWDGFAVSEHSLRDNRVPTLAIVGAGDPLKESVDALQKVMANLWVIVIEGADHGGALASTEFVESVKSFLAEHPIALRKAVTSDVR